MVEIAKKSQKKWILFLSIFAFSMGIICYITYHLWPLYFYKPEKATVLSSLRFVDPFELIDADNQPFTEKQLSGKWTVVFFGFTNCPDICPMTLSTMNQIYQKLEKMDAAPYFQFVFVSVDPERDELTKLKQYTAYFNPNFIAVTGAHDQLQKFSRQLGAMYFTAPLNSNEKNNYTVEHSGSIAVINPQGYFHAVFTYPHTADVTANDLNIIRKTYRG